MTTKTIKTIVFAALFAAMILPFSGMQSVYADETNLPADAELGEADGSLEHGHGGHMPEEDSLDGSHAFEEVDTTPKGESEADLPEYQPVEVEPSNSRGLPVPDDGAYLPADAELDGTLTGEPDQTHAPDGATSDQTHGPEVEIIPNGTHVPVVPIEPEI